MTTPLHFSPAPYGHKAKMQGSDCAFRGMGFPFGAVAPYPAYTPPGTIEYGALPQTPEANAFGFFVFWICGFKYKVFPRKTKFVDK